MRRHWPILLLLYVTLDFTNPLMPGAVSFNAGSLQVVPGDRTARAARPAVAAVRPVTVLPSWVALALDAALARPASLASPRPRPPRAVRRAPPRMSTPPSPSEDH